MTHPLPVLGFVGTSGSGKTTLLEQVVGLLTDAGGDRGEGQPEVPADPHDRPDPVARQRGRADPPDLERRLA
jgi:ABC-type glutathione transport system ATPase component